MSDERQLAGVTAALRAQGSGLDRLSRALTAAALIGLLILPASFGLPPGWPAAILAAVALVGLAELFFAGRVGFDAALFAAAPDLAALDRALLALRLMPEARAGRPLAERAQGARRLLYRQGLCLAAQAALILAGAAAAVAGGGR
jgi:hypothetical protein